LPESRGKDARDEQNLKSRHERRLGHLWWLGPDLLVSIFHFTLPVWCVVDDGRICWQCGDYDTWVENDEVNNLRPWRDPGEQKGTCTLFLRVTYHMTDKILLAVAWRREIRGIRRYLHLYSSCHIIVRK
jgi:hypothetical protein